MRVATRLVFICSLLSISVFVLAAQSAYAKLGPISIRSVYTTDENGIPTIVFAPGTRINYHVDVDNTTGSTFPIDVRFQAFANDYSPDPRLYHYDQTQNVDQMPVGLSRFYTPLTLPTSTSCPKAPCPPSYFYAVRITITPSGCQGTACTNDGDWGENTFSIQSQLYNTIDAMGQVTAAYTTPPKGKAGNLIVLVHGCCTDEHGVKEWVALQKIVEDTVGAGWEVVVWNWHEYTPESLDASPTPGELWRLGLYAAYDNAKHQGSMLARAIAIHPIYQHVHLIGHSAGAKLIHEAARAYIGDYFVREKLPFIHLTFLDAYTPNEWDHVGKDSYGSLPTDYPHAYSEHYVDRTQSIIAPWTNTCLSEAFNFDLTGWKSEDPVENTKEWGHQWPRYWYRDSVISINEPPTFNDGFPLSLEGREFLESQQHVYRPGTQCPLKDITTGCPATPCWR